MDRLAAILVAILVGIAMSSPLAHAVSPSADEMAEALRWAAAKFGDPTEQKTQGRLVVLANHDPVQKNARAGRPLRIADKVYHRGLYCHAPSKVVVKLDSPGEAFEAIVGVDSNKQTRGGRGSVVFSVTVGGKQRFRSDIRREGMPGVPVKLDLGGAKEFLVEVGDAGDGKACDQADWAEARVTLANGDVLWLGDMAMEHPHRATYAPDPPFSFRYGGRPSSALLSTWPLKRSRRKLDDQRAQHTLTYIDPATGLVVRCVAIEYRDFPVVEWTLYFKNEGAKDSHILSDIQALDTRFERFSWRQPDWAEFHLHHHTGSPCTPRDYEPHVARLGPKQLVRFAPPGGRPTDSVLPYFNLEMPSSEGVIVVVGWPGQWAASFERDQGAGLRVRAGQELTHFRLRPGEEVRTPLVVLLFWKGDAVRAQNLWRRWMLAHNVPRPNGWEPRAQLAACSSHQYGEMIHADTANQKMFVDRYLKHGIQLDYWWMDAGWYPNKTGWPNVGTWEVDTKRFPGGLRPICDHAHAKGVKIIVWFEPERVTAGTWLAEKHPEWVLGGRKGGLLNLGNPEARKWLTDHVDKLLTEQGIDLYRQDFNMDPLPYWRGHDAKDRQGITEIRHVEGYLAYWDELRRRHPGLLIDSCASGGRRNDLETLRRAVPLLRSDFILDPVAQQNHAYGIASWIPFYGTGVNAFDAYTFRSQMCPHSTLCYDMRNEKQDFAAVRRLVEQWRSLGAYYFGDYYPLVPYNAGSDVWMAWQFDRPDLGEGMVQVFRRSQSIYEAARLRLRGLDPKADYAVIDLDKPEEKRRFAGDELMQLGLPVAISDQPGARVLVYRKNGM